MNRSPISIQNPDYGLCLIDGTAIDDICTFLGASPQEVSLRLANYRRAEMADAWRTCNPQTPGEVRDFYRRADYYIWQLTLWHHSAAYKPYLQAVTSTLCSNSASDRPRQMLDYGCGIGTTAILAGEAGYQITIADIPGRTFEFAQHRLRRRGLVFDAVPIESELAPLGNTYDLLVCLDVLEHVHAPDRILWHMVGHLRAGAFAVITTQFEGQDEDHPDHLPENASRFGQGRWRLELNVCGLDEVRPAVFRKVSDRQLLLRRLRYEFWRWTGLYLTRIPRPPKAGTGSG